MLDLNMLLRHHYVYVVNDMVSTLFQVMHLPHNGRIFTIDYLESDNYHPNSTFVQTTHLYVPSVHVDSTPPWVNYVASYSRCSIDSEHEPVQSCLPSQNMV
jgi:hypothetical protein